MQTQFSIEMWVILLFLLNEDKVLAQEAARHKAFAALNNNVSSIEHMYEVCNMTIPSVLTDRDPPAPIVSEYNSFGCIPHEKEYNINFLSVALDEKYEMYLPYYTFFALAVNPDSHVEVVVFDPVKFLKQYGPMFSFVMSMHTNKSLCVRGFSSQVLDYIQLNPVLGKNSARLFEVPLVNAKYTYVGDIDVMMTQDVMKSKRLAQMKSFGVPYSNVRRYNYPCPRLTGVYMVDTKAFFDAKLRQKMMTLIYNNTFFADFVNRSIAGAGGLWGMDEVILYELCSVHGEPPVDQNHPFAHYRPLHGAHWSHHSKPVAKGFSNSENCKIILVPGFINMLVNWSVIGSMKFCGYYFSIT